MGFTQAPVVAFKDEIFTGYHPDKLQRMVDEWLEENPWIYELNEEDENYEEANEEPSEGLVDLE